MRKKLFAVIMSAMMMITFMPTMAFAANTIEWNSNYSSVKINGVGHDVTSKVFDASTGLTTATYDNGTSADASDDCVAQYYDFNGAVFGYSAPGTHFALEADSYLNAVNQESKVKDPTLADEHEYSEVLGEYVKLVKPSDAEASGGSAAYIGTAFIESNVLAKLKVVLPRYEAYEDINSMKFDVSLAQNHLNKIDATAETATNNVINLDKASKSCTVDFKITNFSKVMVKFAGTADEEQPFDTNMLTYYCGENQNPTITTKNITVKYSTDFGRTWVAEAPKMVSADSYEFRAQLYFGSNKAGGEMNCKVVVNKAPYALAFKSSNINLLPGQKVKAADILTLKTATEKDGVVDIFAADKAAAQKIFDQCVALSGFPTQETGKGVPVSVFGTDNVVDKAKWNKEIKELEKNDVAVASFLDNYEYATNTALEIFTTKANVFYGVAYNDVTAPNKTLVYKAKNGKLAKNKTYKLTKKVKADYGTLTFTKMTSKYSKIKVAKNGKVTVKKGLKKGTYTVKIKCKAPGAKATMKLTVKVK